MKSVKTQIVEALLAAKTAADKTPNMITRVIVGAGGRGQYEMAYSPSYEIRDYQLGTIATIEDSWTSPSQANCYSYNTYIRRDDSQFILLSELPKKVQAWIESLETVDEAEQLAEQF